MPMKWDRLVAKLPQLDVAASEAAGTDQQREASVTLHETNVSNTSCRQVKCSCRLRVTAEEKPGHRGTADVARITAICPPLQLNSVTLQWRRNQPVAHGNQDASIRIECNVGHIDTWMAYI